MVPWWSPDVVIGGVCRCLQNLWLSVYTRLTRAAAASAETTDGQGDGNRKSWTRADHTWLKLATVPWTIDPLTWGHLCSPPAQHTRPFEPLTYSGSTVSVGAETWRKAFMVHLTICPRRLTVKCKLHIYFMGDNNRETVNKLSVARPIGLPATQAKCFYINSNLFFNGTTIFKW